VTIVTAVVSMLTEQLVRNDTAMTGEISLRGVVLPVGGIKEKVRGPARTRLACDSSATLPSPATPLMRHQSSLTRKRYLGVVIGRASERRLIRPPLSYYNFVYCGPCPGHRRAPHGDAPDLHPGEGPGPLGAFKRPARFPS
jgi:hypothetical protein